MTQLDCQQLKANLKNGGQWIRIACMVLFLVFLYVSMIVVGLLTFIQVLFVLIAGSANENITSATADLIRYINQILLFLAYNDDRKPFPFSPWGGLDQPSATKKDTLKDEHDAIS